MVSESAGPHVLELSAALARSGQDVTVFTGRRPADIPDRGYTVVSLPARPAETLPEGELIDQIGAFVRSLAAHWAAARPDIAHAHSWISGVATQLAAARSRVPTVQTLPAGDRGGDAGVRSALERIIARNADWAAATCTRGVAELTRLGRSRTRTSVVPCGVDLDDFSTEGDVAPRGGMARIVSVGRALPDSGFDTLIAALSLLPAAELVIAGGPDAGDLDGDPEVRRLRALATELGVAQRVTFTGEVPRGDMPALLRSAEVVACTPWHAPFGTVSLEAMACGAPVVATAVGALVDTVVPGVTGRLVTPGRPRECAVAVSALLRDAFLRRSLGLAGRDRARARYSWDRVVGDILRVYRRSTG